MGKRKKEQPVISGVEISGVAAEGNAVARVDDMVVFIPFGAPGDVATIKITKKKKSWAEGRIVEVTTPSSVRQAPPCEHFGVCGGCRWQHLPYQLQLDCKRQQVADALDRIARIPHPDPAPTLGSDRIWDYRNKMEYTFSARSWLTPEQLASAQEFDERRAAGFHITGAFDKVLDINYCHLQDAGIGNELRNFVKELGRSRNLSFYDLRANSGLLRTMMIRTASTGQVMTVMCFGENDPEGIRTVMEAISEKFGNRITSLLYLVNLKVNDTIADQEIFTWSGTPYIEEEMEGLRFRVGPKSFYQTNSLQALKLYTVTRDMAALTGSELVYDLYTGTGTIANFVARQARHVIGIEYVEEAIADARINSQINGIGNTEFYAGDMKDILTAEFIAGHGRPDVMIVDPPRAGMHPSVVEVILGAEPRRIVYVSCNPATQARDLELLHAKYDVEAVQPVDMFPHTAHVENVVRLSLRQHTDGTGN
ncbi:MAG: 23S rRNA (uracil(1939)-C(5))-methyltransferase RlmD [Muribaculaceae bacterium]|nr:23S rRNA (uracil(1939)-C(5))-methyltransferase RlmD [Muribaculaceae bacterium]